MHGIVGSLLVLGVAVGCGCSTAGGERLSDGEQERAWVELEESSRDVARIWPTGGSVGLGKFLLLRRGDALCGVRFTKYFHVGKSEKPTLFSSGQASLYAEYDWYIQSDGTMDFKKDNVKSGHAEVQHYATVGFSRLNVQIGNEQVDCGTFKAVWRYPTGIAFNYTGIGSTAKTDAFEMALTRWDNINDVKPLEATLVWYGFDDARKVRTISADELPK